MKAGESIEDLAESIARRGLIQSLYVRPVIDGEGAETGMFEVPAGGRRYRALALLVMEKRLNKTSLVPCIVSDPTGDILIEEVSLAENVERAPLHPLDQFRAFKAMLSKGMPEEAWAAVRDGSACLYLVAGLKVRRDRVTGVNRVELMGAGESAWAELKALGLISEIISWKTWLFIPVNAEAPAILASVLERHALLRCIAANTQA